MRLTCFILIQSTSPHDWLCSVGSCPARGQQHFPNRFLSSESSDERFPGLLQPQQAESEAVSEMRIRLSNRRSRRQTRRRCAGFFPSESPVPLSPCRYIYRHTTRSFRSVEHATCDGPQKDRLQRFSPNSQATFPRNMDLVQMLLMT